MGKYCLGLDMAAVGGFDSCFYVDGLRKVIKVKVFNEIYRILGRYSGQFQNPPNLI